MQEQSGYHVKYDDTIGHYGVEHHETLTTSAATAFSLFHALRRVDGFVNVVVISVNDLGIKTVEAQAFEPYASLGQVVRDGEVYVRSQFHEDAEEEAHDAHLEAMEEADAKMGAGGDI